jgi:hypothetical protein
MPKHGYKALTVPLDTYRSLEDFRHHAVKDLGISLSLPEALGLAVYLADKWLSENPGGLKTELYKVMMVQYLESRKHQVNKQATNQLLQ